MNIGSAAFLLVPALVLSAGASAYGQHDQAPLGGNGQVRQEQGPGMPGVNNPVGYRSGGGQQAQHPASHPKQPPATPRKPSSAPPGGAPPRQGKGQPPHYTWHGERRDWHGHVYWRADIRQFPRYDWNVWRTGYWYHGRHNGRWAWWWIADGIWFYYPAPIYPYPNPYVPGTVTVINNPAPPEAPPAQAPAAQYWYHCTAPEGYYPYVSECPGGWTKVPATPASSAKTPPPATHH